MSYQVLARKWRPRNFTEMVGQEPTLRMLTHALDQERLHHAYLFTGTRGVGKTTLARILAKCLNCETGISSTPCGTCSICQAVDTGRFLDLIEVDAASRTKVEDTREILENVQYAPSQGRFKIYLIDEVHMLSNHSLNALLKTLEEPPSHVKFLLATTDPKRLPITILSRCLQFNLKRVPREKIAGHLKYICETENLTQEMPALEMLAQAADGSMRDALSLLDQAIAYCGGKINLADTQQMLGSISQTRIFELLEDIAAKDGAKLLKDITTLADEAPNFSQVLEEMLSILHEISLTQIVPDRSASHDGIKKFAAQFSAEDTQLYYQIALIGRRDLPLAAHPQQGFEMVMLRMLAFHPMHLETKTIKPTAKPKAEAQTPTPSAPPIKSAAQAAPQIKLDTEWSSILTKLDLTGMAQMLAANCLLSSINETKVVLTLSKTHSAMLNKTLQERLEQALTQYCNKPMKLEIKIADNDINTPAKQQETAQVARQASAVDSIQNDTQVKKMLEMFDGTVEDIVSVKS